MIRSCLLVTGISVLVLSSTAGQEPDTVRLEPITVTATRVPMRLSTVTAALTVLQGEELRRQGIANVADALRLVPGAATAQSGSFGGTTSLFLRGGESDYTQVLIDGVPVNNPGGSYDFAYLSTANIDRIEVMRGPGSVLYGSDGVTGVVNVITRGGSEGSRISSAIRGGSQGSVMFDAGLSGRRDGVGYSIGVHRMRSDGAYAFNNQYDNTVFSGRFDLRPDEATKVDLSIRYRDSRYAFPTESDGSVIDRNAASLNENTTVAFVAERTLAEQLDLQIQLGSNVGTGGTDDAPDGPADTLGFFGFTSLQDISRQHVDARLNFRPTSGVTVTAGSTVEQQKERSFSESLSAFGPSNGASDNQRGNVAYYAQALASNGTVSTSAGFRTDVNDAFGTFHTYRVGIRYEVLSGTSVRASSGRSFKAPTFFENYATGFVIGNPDLKPEEATTWEVAAEQRFADGRLAVQATYFDQQFRNLIQFTFATAPNYENIAKADASGLELEVSALPRSGLRIFAHATRLVTTVVDAGFDAGPGATFVDGSRLLRRPEWVGSAGVDAHWSPQWAGTIVVHFMGDRDDLDFSAFPSERVVLESATTVDASAHYQLTGGGDGIALTISASNLFDAGYQTVMGFPGRGRTVLGGFRLGR
jgi:vitamin B12 transporter